MLFIKQTNSAWVPAQNFFVKTSASTWQVVKKIFVKTSTNIWQQFWPKSGPISTFSPFFSTDSAGNNVYVNNYVRIGSSLYGQNGTWNNSGFTGISYAYQVQAFSALTGGSNTIILSGTYSSGVLINLTTSSFNGSNSNWSGKYLDFQITDNNAQNIPSVDSAGNGNGRVIVITNPPTNISASMGSAATTFNIGSTATYTATWNGTEAYFPDSTRSNVSWYKSTTLYSTPQNIKTYATSITGTTPSYTNNGTTWTTTSTYTSNSTDSGYYIYAVETEYNSGSDYAGTTQGILKYASTAKVTVPPPVVQSYPYWTDTSNNAFTGPITSGTTLRLYFGAWSNSPTYYNYTIYYNTFPVTIITSNQANTYTSNYVDYTFTYNSAFNSTISAYVTAGNSSGLSNIASPPSVGPVTAVHIIPTITTPFATGITTSSATINWFQTNASYDYVNSTYVGLATSYTFTGLSAGTFYQGTVTVYSTTGDYATVFYNFTTTVAATPPSTPGTPTLNYISANSASWNYTATWYGSTGTSPITYYLHAYGSSDNFSTIQTTKGPFSGTSSGNFTLPKTSVTWEVSAYATNSSGTSGDSGLSNPA